MDKQSESGELKKRRLKVWLNRKTEGKEGFTAMHLAAFHGNLSIINFLKVHEVDIFAENNFLLNSLHVAAQGNQPAVIIHCLNLNFDINSRDRVRSTPLHWA